LLSIVLASKSAGEFIGSIAMVNTKGVRTFGCVVAAFGAFFIAML